MSASLLVTDAAIAFLFGEGLGRLGCLSFGCCYGRPLDKFSPRFQRWLSPLSTVFHGETKKIAYAGGLAGHRVLAIQTITAVLYCSVACVALDLFMRGHVKPALAVSLGLSQLWRVVSEPLRSDHRGSHGWSAYQSMSLAGLALCLLFLLVLPAPQQPTPDLWRGVATV